MNRQNPGIGWCDWTWNPISGCRNGCSYCYARAMTERFGRSFEPAFHPERLGGPAREQASSRIFVGSTTDFGSEGVQAEWVCKVYEAARTAAPWHKYLTLTKRPDQFPVDVLPGFWCGVTVTDQADAGRTRGYMTPSWASCEPLLGPVRLHLKRVPLDWLVIGALTGPGGTVPPSNGGTRREWVAGLLKEAAEAKVPVYVKSNAAGLVDGPRLQQFPKGLET